MKNIIYEKPFLKAMRIFACIAAGLLIVVTSVRIYNSFITKLYDLNLNNIMGTIENIIAIVLFYLIILQPQKIEYLAIVSFMYSFHCLSLNFDNSIGILMYALGISVLYVRGFFIKKTKIKIIISVIIYICLFLGGILYGLLIVKIPIGSHEYYDSIMDKLGYTLVLSIILFLLIIHNHSYMAEMQAQTKTLNLAEYPGLNETDVVLLQLVLENEQYKNIACAVYKAPGTIRNRLNKIYDILGVMDRIGFISTYLGYEIVFEKSNDIE